MFKVEYNNQFDNLHVQIAGYAIYMVFVRSLSGWLPIAPAPKTMVQVDLENCASWYLTNIIGQRLAEFERFAL